MKTLLSIILVAMALVGTASAGTETLTVGLTATTLSSSTIPNSWSPSATCVCVLETTAARFTLDGTTNPTTSVGVLLSAGQTLKLNGRAEMQNLKIISAGTSTATMGCTCN